MGLKDAGEPADHLGSFLDAISDDEDPSSKRVRERVLGTGRVIAERYKLGDRIARGGMATIWEATDTKLNRVVAIKFMGQAYTDDAEYRKRFEEEARAAAQLRTPFVVAIHDHGVAEGVPFIVMERLDGEDLHQRMHRQKRLPVAFVAKVATEASKALKIAHAAGIVHRDLKPKNLFISKEDDEEVIKLLDFGVAKHAGTAALMTATGVMLGSPFYMSPEQIRCERNLDGRTDLWSLAAILYRALTGAKAFDGDMARVMFQITRERPKAPSLLCPDLPKALDAFFDKALATRREDRFSSAMELAEAFNTAARASNQSTPSMAIPPAPSSQSGTRPALAPRAPDEAPGADRIPAEGLGTEPLIPGERYTEPPSTAPRGVDVALLEESGPKADLPRPMGPPSDHPTFAAPVGVITNLVTAKNTSGTGLRLGPLSIDAPDVQGPVQEAARPTPRVVDAPTEEPRDAPADVSSLTPEQRSGFAVGSGFESDARWQAYALTSSRPAAVREPRSWSFIVAASLIILTTIGLTIGLVFLFR
jgi:serine/threonine protein kinase